MYFKQGVEKHTVSEMLYFRSDTKMFTCRRKDVSNNETQLKYSEAEQRKYDLFM